MLWNFQNFTLKFINGKSWKQKEGNLQNKINIAFLILFKLFQKQTNKLNSENWLEVRKPKLNTNTEVYWKIKLKNRS